MNLVFIFVSQQIYGSFFPAVSGQKKMNEFIVANVIAVENEDLLFLLLRHSPLFSCVDDDTDRIHWNS